MDVGAWLRSLGLERYEAAFRDNEIDGTVLPNLTAEDLKDLGVGIVGHRRRLLDAIAALRSDTNAKPPPLDPFPVTDRSAKDSAERRQVTVMFSDLVGSTALAALLDPEDLREIIALYHKCAADIVRRSGGFVSQYLGDGVMVYFGYPEAHEDDAERAVRAGLELVSAVAELNTRVALKTRVGIATGLVVVGDLIDAGGAQERGIIGETPNLAARLQDIAEPSMVVIAESTRRLLGNFFELQDLGAKELKGVARSARVWAVLRASSVASRFEALHASGLTTLVGRGEESELLLRRWARAKSGEGQVALLTGEAGIGKSRLTATLLESIAAEPHTRLRYFCSPQHTDSALYPIIGQMERVAGLAHDDAPQTRLDKLDKLLAQTSTSAQDAALFAEMLSLPNDGRYPALELPAEERRQRTLQALLLQMQTLVRQNPVLIIFEDAHWADPTSLEVFGRVVDRIRSLRVLLIVTFRIEFQPPWIGQPHVTALTINRLTEREIGAMIDRVVGDKLLPANVRQDIIERTDGVPLFAEEMTKAVLEAESEGQARRTTAAVAPPVLAVPASLHASLMARLDRLGSAKEIAQIGAVIGREFSHALLAAVVGKRQAELTAALDRLVQSGLLFRQGVPPNASYLFKHALVQDTAYSTLLREPRRALHARTGDVLEDEFPNIAENQPELLARHFTEAGLIEKAAGFWGKAGQRSFARSALVEAIEQLTRAIAQIATLPATPALRREQIKLQVAIITPLAHVKGYAAPETKAAMEQARLLIEQAEALGEPAEDPLLLFSVLYGMFVANFNGFDGDEMRKLAPEFLALAERQGATAPMMIGHRMMGIWLTSTGNAREGRAHLDRALALYDPAAHRPLATRFSIDSRVSILGFRSVASWFLGYPEAALADSKRAVDDAREIGHAASLMFILQWACMVEILCGNYASAEAPVNELVSLADQKGSPFWKAIGVILQGGILALTGAPAKAAQVITANLGLFQSMGSRLMIPFYSSFLARAYADLNQFDDAWRAIGEATTAVETGKESWFEVEVHRTAGEVALKMREPDMVQAEAYFDRALASARAQEAKSWELRAATSMARLWRDQGKRGEASALLAPVYGWFTEGFDTRDLKEAKILLKELAS